MKSYMETSDARDIILDSSVWIAFLRDTDTQHEKARRVLADSQTDTIIVPEYVLVEVATTLKRLKSEDVSKQFVIEVMEDGDPVFLPVGDALPRETARIFVSGTKDGLSFTDTALLVLSKRFRIITFDRRLQRAIDQS